MKRKKKPAGTISTLALVTQIGIAMLVPIALCGFGGYYLGKLVHAEAPVFIFFMFFGMAVGYRNIWGLVKKYTKNDKPKEEVPEELSEAEKEFRKWKEEKNNPKNNEMG